MIEVTQFLKTAADLAPAPIYLLCPDKAPGARNATFEPLLADQAVAKLIDRFVEPSMKDMCFTSCYADEMPSGEIVSIANTMPFLADYRVILVRNAEHYDSERALGALNAYLSDPCETSILIFVAAQIDRRSKFFKICDKNATVIACPELRERDLALWINKQAEELGKSIDPKAVSEIAGRAGPRLNDVLNAIRQAAGYVGDRDTIRDADVVAACADVAEEEIWTLTDAIGESNSDAAIHSLRRLLDLGKNEFEVMGSINWVVRCAYSVASGEGKSLSPFVAKKFSALAKKWGTAKAAAAFGLLMDAEILLRSTGVDRALALELLVIKLSYSARPAKAAS